MVFRAAIPRSPLIGRPLMALTFAAVFAAMFAAQSAPLFAADYVVTLLGSGYSSSLANGINGGRVAVTGFNSNSSAAAWTISTSSRVTLPLGAGIGSAEALAIDGNTVAGQVYSTSAGFYHAYTWNLTSGTFLDLNPSGYDQSAANGTSNGAFVGDGITGGASQALYWPTAQSTPTNLTPSIASDSTALAISNGVEVGSATIAASGRIHAMAWNGTASSFIDLHSPLPSSLTDSVAAAVSGTKAVGTAYEASAPRKRSFGTRPGRNTSI